MSIDLNADVGEGLDAADAAIAPLITSANIACGGHAGDVRTMRPTVALALEHGVGIGAHPGYPDRAGFGRREISIGDAQLRASVREQLEALGAVAHEAGARAVHVKPHGLLYNQAAADPVLARLLAEVVASTALARAGQLRPGDEVRFSWIGLDEFSWIGLDEARIAAQAQADRLASIAASLA